MIFSQIDLLLKLVEWHSIIRNFSSMNCMQLRNHFWAKLSESILINGIKQAPKSNRILKKKEINSAGKYSNQFNLLFRASWGRNCRFVWNRLQSTASILFYTLHSHAIYLWLPPFVLIQHSFGKFLTVVHFDSWHTNETKMYRWICLHSQNESRALCVCLYKWIEIVALYSLVVLFEQECAYQTSSIDH